MSRPILSDRLPRSPSARMTRSRSVAVSRLFPVIVSCQMTSPKSVSRMAPCAGISGEMPSMPNVGSNPPMASMLAEIRFATADSSPAASTTVSALSMPCSLATSTADDAMPRTNRDFSSTTSSTRQWLSGMSNASSPSGGALGSGGSAPTARAPVSRMPIAIVAT